MYVPYQSTINALQGTGNALAELGTAQTQDEQRRARSILQGKQLDIEAAKTAGEQAVGLMGAQNMNERLKQETARVGLEQARVDAAKQAAIDKQAQADKKAAFDNETGTLWDFMSEPLKTTMLPDQIAQHRQEMEAKYPGLKDVFNTVTTRKQLPIFAKQVNAYMLKQNSKGSSKEDRLAEHDKFIQWHDAANSLNGVPEDDPEAQNASLAADADNYKLVPHPIPPQEIEQNGLKTITKATTRWTALPKKAYVDARKQYLKDNSDKITKGYIQDNSLPGLQQTYPKNGTVVPLPTGDAKYNGKFWEPNE